MKISLIVLGFKNFNQHTRECLDSIIIAGKKISDPKIEIFAVDNGSPDNSAQHTIDYCKNNPEIRPVIIRNNLGFAGGMNYAASFCESEWIGLVNNDTIFPADAIQSLIKVLMSAPRDIGIICPVTNNAGNSQKICLNYSNDELQTIAAIIHTNPTNDLIDIYRADFFCIFIRKSLWIELNGLSPDYGLGYYEDFDFSLAAQKAGWKIALTEDVFIIHKGSATFSKIPNQKEIIKQNKSAIRKKFKDIKFNHQRDCILNVLNQNAKKNSFRYDFRKSLRKDLLRSILPRSPLKRILWLLKNKTN